MGNLFAMLVTLQILILLVSVVVFAYIRKKLKEIRRTTASMERRLLLVDEHLKRNKPVCTAVLEKNHPNAKKLLKLLPFFVTKSVLGGELIRLGRKNDGGYVMLNEFDEKMEAYSFGINDDISWDLDIANRGLNCWMYDHTIQRLPAIGGVRQ